MSNSLIKNFDKLMTWKRKDERAPHKPLLALWAIGRCLGGENRLVEYEVVHNELINLLQKFGHPRKTNKPHEPFWRMRKDQIWEIPQAHIVSEQKNGSVSPSDLRQLNISGGFPETLYNAFRGDPTLALTVAQKLVEAHFPYTMRAAVLEVTLKNNFNKDLLLLPRAEFEYSNFLTDTFSLHCRDPHFRKIILNKYEYKCALCGHSFQFPVGHWPALEAAHIRWHSHCGPDISENGLSLCVLHHALFDWGIFTIEPDSFNVSVTAEVLKQFPDSEVAKHHEKQLQKIPKCETDRPAAEYLNWHIKNVFRN